VVVGWLDPFHGRPAGEDIAGPHRLGEPYAVEPGPARTAVRANSASTLS
jgi:hypothetical protein